ncbi:methyltransferase domain-containing protein [Micromonospora ureilytica]|uniref:tRNA (Cmo5U34)-methyltransferase n=1 Tax=Micromonospora ureilytica TaxID=709868 RepID=A0ABS0JRG8_9ACTN|nr:methyltransferase domain-containing protein [Micromonospora ureilytica]MBG6069640.1 tRNA (cmo5U34)-methyltransferase [Micromonospora ureilytica]WSR57117.1 methyltransferase domain-containing protein [Micromonospora ureilytica]
MSQKEKIASPDVAAAEATDKLRFPPQVGDNITLTTPQWTFSDGTAEHFDEHVSRSVPGYQDGHDVIAQLSDFFATPGSRIVEVGCSTAALTAKLAERHLHADVKFLGIDIVSEMVAQARQRCNALPNVNIELGDALRIDYSDCSLVVMYYTLQFVAPHKRPNLIRRICSEMLPGGALVLFEKTRLPEPHLQDIFNQCYEEFKVTRGFSSDEILGKARSLRSVLEPFTSAENIAMLKQAGFARTELIHKNLAFEGLIGVKPVVTAGGES